MSIHHIDRPAAKASGHTTTILAPAASRERKCMALVPGSGLGYTDELHDLLRRRLRIVCLILLLGSGAFFARSLVAPTGMDDVQQQIIHAVVLLVLGTCTATLWSRMPLGAPCLRRIELIAFGAVVGYFGYLQVRDFAAHSILRDIPEGEQARVFQLATIGIAMRWFAVIALYGAFVPNTWRRCLAVVSVFTFVPMGLMITVCFKCPVMGPLWPAAIFDMAFR